ncbi:MAG: hypothetical protein K1X92_16345 [Bacteroidia bacterium]|nr:hypothetical protein [Bacteroidia bacterium]
MEVFNKILGYLLFRKKSADAPSSINLNIMHGINRISIFMFLICLILLAVKLLNR